MSHDAPAHSEANASAPALPPGSHDPDPRLQRGGAARPHARWRAQPPEPRGRADRRRRRRQHGRHDPRRPRPPARPPGAHILASPSNKGKGSAIRKGVVVSRGPQGDLHGRRPGDSLEAIDPMIERLDHADVVVGSRRAPGAVVTGRSRSRTVMHHAFSAPRAARQIAGLHVSDPQCGFKGFRAEVGQDLFRRSMFDGFSIDVEILPDRREDRPAGRGDPDRVACRGGQQGARAARPRSPWPPISRACATATAPPGRACGRLHERRRRPHLAVGRRRGVAWRPREPTRRRLRSRRRPLPPRPA